MPARDRVAVGLLTAATAAVHGAYGLSAFRRFELGSYDLVIFDQAIRGYAALGAPVSPLKGVHNGFGPQFSVLGDHASPALAVLAPLYWWRPAPTTLLVAQAVLFASSVPVVWAFTRRALGRRAAYPVAAAYALCWPLQAATAVGFHEVAFAVPLTALAIERAQAQRYGQAAAAALGLLLVKEDLGLVVAAFGVVLALRGRRRLGLALAATGLVAVAVAVRVVIPAAGGRSGYYAGHYDLLFRAGPLDALAPLGPKAALLGWLLVPTLGLALGSPLVLLAVPLVAERLLSGNPNHWGTGQHYSAFVAPVLFLAAVEVAARLPRRWPAAWARLTATVAVVLCAYFPFRDLVTGHAWRPPPPGALAAVRAVPDGATVEAANTAGPHLSARARVLLLDRTPRGAEWIVAPAFGAPQFPFASAAELAARLQQARDAGFVVAHAPGGYLVLHRPFAPLRR